MDVGKVLYGTMSIEICGVCEIYSTRSKHKVPFTMFKLRIPKDLHF